jgi:hypothetical protein
MWVTTDQIMLDTCDYIYWAKLAGIELIFEVTDDM